MTVWVHTPYKMLSYQRAVNDTTKVCHTEGIYIYILILFSVSHHPVI